jgi:hypothetical protein
MPNIRPHQLVKVPVKLEGYTSVQTTTRSDTSEEELKRRIAEKIEVLEGVHCHLHITSTTEKTQGKFAVQEGWTCTISTKDRQAQPPPQLGEIPMNTNL